MLRATCASGLTAAPSGTAAYAYQRSESSDDIMGSSSAMAGAVGFWNGDCVWSVMYPSDAEAISSAVEKILL
jgi:hypothetical protein